MIRPCFVRFCGGTRCQKKKASHGGRGVHGVIFGEARLKTGIKRLING
jgi:hypothetical protein